MEIAENRTENVEPTGKPDPPDSNRTPDARRQTSTKHKQYSEKCTQKRRVSVPRSTLHTLSSPPKTENTRVPRIPCTNHNSVKPSLLARTRALFKDTLFWFSFLAFPSSATSTLSIFSSSFLH